jgi:hypothetical protein
VPIFDSGDSQDSAIRNQELEIRNLKSKIAGIANSSHG